MALAININDLLNKQKIESNRIEFKKGWNPGSIYHSICAFANDYDDLGGGYIIVGVDTDDKTGMAIRPAEGVPLERLTAYCRRWLRTITRWLHTICLVPPWKRWTANN
mgnify:CR=1 FL=1